MLPILQLLIAIFAIYSTFIFSGELTLLVPLLCLFLMLFVNRIDKKSAEKKVERDIYLKENIDKAIDKGSSNIKDQNFFTVESLLWPKNELLLTDAVHSILKDLGLKISTGINYHSVDRIVKIPNTQNTFGVEILMNERETDQHHPKFRRALEFEKEKKENEKTLIIASTYIHLPLSERGQMQDMPEDLNHFLIRHKMSFISAYQLYELWQKTKGGEDDIIGFFQKLHSHLGGIFHLKETENSQPPSFEQSIQ